MHLEKVYQPYMKRLYGIVFVGMIFWIILLYRLFSIQVQGRDQYMALAEYQYKRSVTLRAKRGRILDRHGEVMAFDLNTRSFFANPSEIKDPVVVAGRFAKITGRSQASLLDQLVPSRPFVWLARQVAGDLPADIQTLKSPGVGYITESKRIYPYRALAGQLLGYTDIDNLGIEGGELAFESFLRGEKRTAILQIDGKGKVFPVVETAWETPKCGRDVMLTIDAVYQAIAEQEMKRAVEESRAKSGMTVIMDPRTGEILAMVNIALYDPNRPARYKAELRKNRIITDLYEPGSTFKIVTASAILNREIQAPGDSIFCEEGRMSVAGGVIHDAHPHDWLTFQEVIEQSSNIGVGKLARALGKVRLHEYIRLFGFGCRTDIGLPGEAEGVVKHPSLWSGRSLETIAIGQEVSVTALQITNAYSAIANGGLLMKPQIIKAVLHDGVVRREMRPEVIRRVVSPETARTMKKFLVGVVERGTGTKAEVQGVEVAGKTGTAQKVKEDGTGYAEGQFISSFVGFLPASDPRLVCLVILDSPPETYWGGQMAAPVFKRIVDRILNLKNRPVLYRLAEQEPVSSEPTDPPDLRGMSKTAVERTLARYGRRGRFTGTGGWATAQSDEGVRSDARISVAFDSPLSDSEKARREVPKVVGTTVRQAVMLLSSKGLKSRLRGNGIVRRQTPTGGTMVENGTVCILDSSPSPNVLLAQNWWTP